MKTKDIFVTKEWLAEKISKDPSKVIGRALSAIYRNQSYQEQDDTVTVLSNGIGFSKPDARIGSIGARMFNSKGVLEPWVISVWSRPAKDGLPRICKYAGQLNDIARAKAVRVLSQAQNQNGRLKGYQPPMQIPNL